MLASSADAGADSANTLANKVKAVRAAVLLQGFTLATLERILSIIGSP